LGEGVFKSRCWVPKHSRNKPRYRIHNDHGRDFSPGEDVITDGYLIIGQIKPHPFINPFVVTTDEDYAVVAR